MRRTYRYLAAVLAAFMVLAGGCGSSGGQADTAAASEEDTESGDTGSWSYDIASNTYSLEGKTYTDKLTLEKTADDGTIDTSAPLITVLTNNPQVTWEEADAGNLSDTVVLAREDPDPDALPEFVYVGMDEASRICTSECERINEVTYTQADVMIPAFTVVSTDETDESDVRILCNLWMFNYEKDGDTLKAVSGGEYPCLLHARSEDTGVRVYKVETKESGLSLAADEQAQLEDQDSMASVRKDFMSMYVYNYDLSFTSFTDLDGNVFSINNAK